MLRNRVSQALLALVCVLLPATVFAQASITGTVKDDSGAVLPGVTVEAASPVLIEKVRTVVTDGTGQFRIVDLRPGSYSVTFTLTGFNTVKREGVELSGSATVVVNADLKVGSLEETITVTGQAATVDVQSTTKQQVINQETIATVPTGRNYQNLGILIPGVSAVNNSSTRQQDVGGAVGDNMAMLMAHGSRPQDMRVTQNGVSTATLQAGGGIGGSNPNVGAAAEVTIDTSAVSAELSTGGPRVNFIPRDGGNQIKGFTYLTFSNEHLQGDNVNDDLRSRGFTSGSGVRNLFDLNPGIGGPFVKDKVWFFTTGRYSLAQNYVGGAFVNTNANNPNAWTYAPDYNQRAYNDTNWKDAQIRVTTQANQKNKFAFTYDQQERCSCPWSISATRAQEAGADYRFPQQRLVHGEWSSPVTNKLLLEAVGLHRTERWGNMDLDSLDVAAASPSARMISVTEQGGLVPGLTYRGWTTYTNTWLANYTWRAAVSYVTGAHSFKAGVGDTAGEQRTRTYNFVPLAYRFNNGVPNQVTEYATPYEINNKLKHEFGIFAQDKWTINRLTVTGGVRFDLFQTGFGEGQLLSGELVPGRNVVFPEADNLNWKDVTPRMGAVYDLFGNGKTAIKVSLNKYLGGIGLNGIAQDPNPVNTHVNNVSRAWTDANGNFVVDCDLLNPAAQNLTSSGGDSCGAMSNPNFGKAVATSTFDPQLLAGWGNRSYNWEFSTSVQHELMPRVSVDIGYFRRWFGNFRVTDNLAVPANGYDQFTITAPTDARLPNGGGYQVTGLDLNPAYFGIAPNNFNTLSDVYGKMTDHWNGVDVTLQARLQNGILLQGGFSTGRETIDACDITSKIPELLNNSAGVSPSPLAGPGFTGAGFNLANVWLSPTDCRSQEAWQSQVKLVGIYTVPKIDVTLSGTYQDTPGPVLAANYVVSNAAAQASLGRALSGNAANTTLDIVSPGSLYGDRVHLVDLRFSKPIRAGRTKTNINVDVANLLNSNAVVTELFGYNPSNAAAWRRPNDILSARFIKFGINFDF
jgi:hypothetical protein